MATWREMTTADVDGLMRVADLIHPGLPESPAVFAERIALFPRGCLALVSGGEVCGYAISHPIRAGHPPALDSLLGGALAPDADQYYIHDVAVLPSLRGAGHAARCIRALLAVADAEPGCGSTCLVSVYGTAGFWARFGFVEELADEALSEKLRGYGDDATYMVRRKK